MPLTQIQIKTYAGIINQTGTEDPIVTVLHNDIGNIIWTRFSNGYYRGTLTNAFDEETTTIILTGTNITQHTIGEVESDSVIAIQNADITDPGVGIDNLDALPIEIKIYYINN